jgi:glycosyltransferase involved in cell wall biosynthesis
MSTLLLESSVAAAQERRSLISVIVPTLNEEEHIASVLDDMLAQERLDADVEILVADGGSTDKTREIVDRYKDRGEVRLVDNPQRRQVFGYNRAIKEARGSIICIAHAHARFSKDYLAACLAVRKRTGAANVGGVIRHRGEGLVGEAIALAMSSPLGVGNSSYRHAKREQWCDSIMGTFMDRRIFDEIGLYNETNFVNEDCEFNYRLRAAGYRVFVSPAIEATYFVRSSIAALARQYAVYGFFRRWTEVQHPGSVPRRVYAPPALILGLAGSVLLGALGFEHLAIVVPALYLCVLCAGVFDGLRRSKRVSLALFEPLAIATMHFAFGFGWLLGFLKLKKPAELSK